MTTLAQAFQEMLAALDRTETPFFVGGSVASSTHGLARLTNDVDIVVDLPLDRVPAFCEALGANFHADAAAVSGAMSAGRPFNLIHLASAYKFDFFTIGSDAFSLSELARRRFTTSTMSGLEHIEFPIASPEHDSRKAGLVSERWRGVGPPVARHSGHDQGPGGTARPRSPSAVGWRTGSIRFAGQSSGVTLIRREGPSWDRCGWHAAPGSSMPESLPGSGSTAPE